jgi:hypothetical protein
MKRLIFLAAGAVVATTAAACAPTVPPVAHAALDCPATRGELTRTSISADKKTCLYTTHDGDEVSLRLVAFTGDVEGALAPIQKELESEVGPPGSGTASSAAVVDLAAGKAASADAARAAKEAADDAKDAAKEAVKAAKESTDEAKGAARDAAKDAESQADAAAEAAEDARGENEETHVDLPGIHIDANRDGGAKVDVGMVHIDANDSGAVVHISRDVRMRGEAFSREKRGYRSTYILTQDNLKNGYRAVGYEAGGPRVGPIAVAVVKSRSHDHDDLFDDVKKLVRLNGGV